MSLLNLQLIAFVLLVSQLTACTTSTPERRGAAITIPASQKTRPIEADADSLGRQLYDASHVTNPAFLEELRNNEPRFIGLSDSDIMGYMHAMGPNYTWYLSDDNVSGVYGVLILTHGFRDLGDRVLEQQLRPLGQLAPTALAAGMSMMHSDHIQLALNNLAAAGAQDIIVVPAVSSRFNSMARQWEYIFGLREQPEYASVLRIVPPVPLHVVAPLGANELVGEILAEYAAEISSNPAGEEVIIVAHGPTSDADNRIQLEMLEQLAGTVRAHSDYAAVHVITLQDDAPTAVRAANVRALREQVKSATDRGREALIISNLLGVRTVQGRLRRDLFRLQYRFNPKGLVEHPNFIRWVEMSVSGVVADLQ
jgi:sirohydrochlorin ferrochelatase